MTSTSIIKTALLLIFCIIFTSSKITSKSKSLIKDEATACVKGSDTNTCAEGCLCRKFAGVNSGYKCAKSLPTDNGTSGWSTQGC